MSNESEDITRYEGEVSEMQEGLTTPTDVSILEGDDFSEMIQKAVDTSLRAMNPPFIEEIKSTLKVTIQKIVDAAVSGRRTELKKERKSYTDHRERQTTEKIIRKISFWSRIIVEKT